MCLCGGHYGILPRSPCRREFIALQLLEMLPEGSPLLSVLWRPVPGPHHTTFQEQPTFQMTSLWGYKDVQALFFYLEKNLEVIPAPELHIGWASASVETITKPSFSPAQSCFLPWHWSQEHLFQCPFHCLFLKKHDL